VISQATGAGSSIMARAATTVASRTAWNWAARLIAPGQTGAGPVVEFALAAIFTGEIGVAIYRRRILRPRWQEKLFQIKFGLW
jgi:hypothetical protein